MVILDEGAMADLLSEEDLDGLQLVKRSRWYPSWERTLEKLDNRPWARLHPMFVAKRFETQVLTAVRERLEEELPPESRERKLRAWEEAVEAPAGA